MRIAYIDPHPVPDILPATLQILQTVDALAEAGSSVDLITPQPLNNLTPADVLGRNLANKAHLLYLPDIRQRWWFPSSSNKPFYFLARRLLRRSQYDAILVRNLKLADYLISRPLGIPVFFETHEIFAQSFREQFPMTSITRNRKLEALIRRESLVYSQARGIICITQHLIEDIKSHYGVNTPAVLAPDGVDLHLAQPSGRQAASDKPLMLLYLGSLHPWKGVEILIRAMPFVERAELHIAGGTETRIAELSRLAQELNIAGKVVFLGPISPVRRFELIDRADICLLPLANTSIGSRYTSPLKLFEYMAMGKPIIISDLPAIREVLVQAESALLVEPENPSAIAEAVTRLQQNTDLAKQLGEHARQLAHNRYSWLARAQKIAKFMQQHIRMP
ncbi:MAG: WalM protein [Nitrosomonadales bacterium]|nr:MAG: WalM protein [Nitrosomonadales bacterium]